jgi:hypothetical protein
MAFASTFCPWFCFGKNAAGPSQLSISAFVSRGTDTFLSGFPDRGLDLMAMLWSAHKKIEDTGSEVGRRCDDCVLPVLSIGRVLLPWFPARRRTVCPACQFPGLSYITVVVVLTHSVWWVTLLDASFSEARCRLSCAFGKRFPVLTDDCEAFSGAHESCGPSRIQDRTHCHDFQGDHLQSGANNRRAGGNGGHRVVCTVHRRELKVLQAVSAHGDLFHRHFAFVTYSANHTARLHHGSLNSL